MLGTRNEDYAKKWFEEHEEALRSGWEATRRDQELDGDGVAGEIIFPDADAVESRTCVPFGAGLGMSGDMDPVITSYSIHYTKLYEAKNSSNWGWNFFSKYSR